MRNNEEYQFPEQRFMTGNPPDYGDFAGLTNFGHAFHVASKGNQNIEDLFNNNSPIILGFKAYHNALTYGVNHMQIDGPELGLGILVAPMHLKEKIEAKIKENYDDPSFNRIYVSVAQPN